MTDAKEMLEAVDAFMMGSKVSQVQFELAHSVEIAAAFAAAAYDHHAPKSGGECHALARAFLLALINPLHHELDYLRENQQAADAARQAREAIQTIRAETKGE